ncbi:LysE family translocator [Gammaproteobacteria bacterium]|nr:LysE family translocator [Gammaproteobacteria bacterium]
MSDLSLLLPFIAVAWTMWATPGPNNMMLAYSGARFGIRRTLPHIVGIVAGTCLLNMLAILGLKPLIERWPLVLDVLRIVGTVWLLWIGWKMATAQRRSDVFEEQPMGLVAALLFQFANPKAISATLATASLALVAIDKNPWLLLAVLLVIPPLSFVSISPWVVAGRSIRRFLSTPRRWTLFSWITGGLTAACAVFLWI